MKFCRNLILLSGLLLGLFVASCGVETRNNNNSNAGGDADTDTDTDTDTDADTDTDTDADTDADTDTDTDADTDTDSDGDTDADSDGDAALDEPVVCDGTGDCEGDCWGCAEAHLCLNSLKDCEDDNACNKFKKCVGTCDALEDDAWWNCYVDCGGDSQSNAEKLLIAFWDCVYCGACKNDCLTSEWDNCSTIAPPDTGDISDDGMTWREANLTWYESYPDPGSEECEEYNGCEYSGSFTYFGGETKSEAWVAANNIIAVHSDDYSKYEGQTLRIRQGSNSIDATVYDLCSDDDCDGCCSDNMSETGFLIDMEMYTFNRFGGETGVVEWTCITCDK